MLEKIITPQEFAEVNVIRPSEAFGVKCASRDVGVCHNGPCTVKQANDELKAFVRGLKADPKYLYLHIIALGSGEYFGPNTNGDYFPEDGLRRKHDTFVSHSKHYKHHINKNPLISYGHPVFSTYNHPMHRVELILAVDRGKAPDLVQSAENGEHLSYSMSCKIPFDVCSICDNKARTKREYCSHIRNQLLEILSDGRQVYMINPDPTFFDISYVLRPADKTARMISKVACESVKEIASRLKPKINKNGAIIKEIDVVLPPMLPKQQQQSFVKDAMPLLIDAEPELPIDRFKEYRLNDILSTLALCGIICRPCEYDKIMIVRKISDPEGITPSISVTDFNDDMYSAIKDVVPQRSFYCPHIINRLQKIAAGGREYVIREAPGQDRQPFITGKRLLIGAGAAGAGYAAYRTELGKRLLANIAEMIDKRPGKFILIAGLGALAVKTAPILGPRQVTDSLVVLDDIPGHREGIVVEGFKAAAVSYGHLRPATTAVIRQSMQPFSVLFAKNY